MYIDFFLFLKELVATDRRTTNFIGTTDLQCISGVDLLTSS